MSDLTNRLRKGFDFLCRENQIDSYQAISNEAANRIDRIESENLYMQSRINELEKNERLLKDIVFSYYHQLKKVYPII
jgi:vacuolar-type H+-ATPase subunit E/Vma4